MGACIKVLQGCVPIDYFKIFPCNECLNYQGIYSDLKMQPTYIFESYI